MKTSPFGESEAHAVHQSATELHVDLPVPHAASASDLELSFDQGHTLVVDIASRDGCTLRTIRHALGVKVDEEPVLCRFDTATKHLTMVLTKQASKEADMPVVLRELTDVMEEAARQKARQKRCAEEAARQKCCAEEAARETVKAPSPENEALENALGDFPVKLQLDSVMGRGLAASRALKSGELLLVSEPLAPVVSDELSAAVCSNCFEEHQSAFLFGCRTCQLVSFCCAECQQSDTHPNLECRALRHFCGLHLMAPPADCSRWPLSSPMAYGRAMIKHFAADFLHKSEQAGDSRVTHNRNTTTCDWQLLSRGEVCTNNELDFMIRLCDAILAALEHVGVTNVTVNEVLALMQTWVGNAHEIFVSGRKVDMSLFPTGSLFNHSCQPHAIQSWRNGNLEIRAIRDLVENEHVCILYIDPFICQQKRQGELQRLHLFTCACQRCEDIHSNARDLQQSGYACSRCSGCLVEGSTQDLVHLCDNCGTEASSTPLAAARHRCQQLVKQAELMSRAAAHKPEARVALLARSMEILALMLESKDGKLLHWSHMLRTSAHQALMQIPMLFPNAPLAVWQKGISNCSAMLRQREHVYSSVHPGVAQLRMLRGRQYAHIATDCGTANNLNKDECLQAAVDDFTVAARILLTCYGSLAKETTEALTLLTSTKHTLRSI